MTILIVGVVVLGLAALTGLALGYSRRFLNRTRRVAEAVIRDPAESTVLDEHGAVRSIQGADLTLPAGQLERLWTPDNLERLASTYWRFLTRVTLGVIRVRYTEHQRFVVFLGRPFTLLAFQAPEYEMNLQRGVVRWRIEKGLLVSRRGRGGNGYLQIDVQRCAPEGDGRGRVHVEVEVANFYPSIASGIGQWVYAETQSRIHVIVTHAFLRSLARLDLAESRGRLHIDPAEVVDPAPAGHPAREGSSASSAGG